jgi:hypothetical protein
MLVSLVTPFLLAACGPYDDAANEVVHLLINGTCGSQITAFDMTQSLRTLTLTYPDSAGSVPLPRRGALDQAGHPLREGGWMLWGCVSGVEPCPGSFRLCTAHRMQWHLNVTCVDGTGAPACQAILTE